MIGYSGAGPAPSSPIVRMSVSAIPSTGSAYEFSTIGVVALSFVLLSTAKGNLGTLYVWLLAAVITGMVLLNYQQISQVFFTQAPAQGG